MPQRTTSGRVPPRDTCATSSAAEVSEGQRRLPQTMNRCMYRLTAVSVSVLTLPR